LSSLHEVLNTPSDQENPFSDVIERIGRINLDVASSPSKKAWTILERSPKMTH